MAEWTDVSPLLDAGAAALRLGEMQHTRAFRRVRSAAAAARAARFLRHTPLG